LGVINADSAATSSSIATSSNRRLEPALAISVCPAHAVTPLESSASLTTNSEAMNTTAGSPNPATV
jgi:hypothetical protein